MSNVVLIILGIAVLAVAIFVFGIYVGKRNSKKTSALIDAIDDIKK